MKYKRFTLIEEMRKRMTEDIFSKHIQKALEWVHQVKDELDQKDLNLEHDSHVLDALRAVLHQLRDNLPVIEAAHLSSQLPLIIRGLYFEGWQPSKVPVKERKSINFVHSVRDNLEQYIKDPFDDTGAEMIIKAVFRTLESHIDEGELDKLYTILPAGVREFIP